MGTKLFKEKGCIFVHIILPLKCLSDSKKDSGLGGFLTPAILHGACCVTPPLGAPGSSWGICSHLRRIKTAAPLSRTVEAFQKKTAVEMAHNVKWEQH
jgi:hypothetical protein